MPELPEVETIVEQLNKRIVGKKIINLEVTVKKMVDLQINKILNQKIKRVWRRAKSIIIEFDHEKIKNNLDKHFLLVHLRMDGHFHYAKKGEEQQKLAPFYNDLVAKFYLDDQSTLTHNSTRKFGSIRLLNKEQLEKELAKLGPEPLSPEFTVKKLAEMFNSKRKSNIKTLLMDQNFLAGVGNIYAQEVLYYAKVDPNRKVESLTKEEIEKIHHYLQTILTSAIKHHGTSVESYIHIEGSGGYQNFLAVYHQEKCPQHHKLIRKNLGGRGTYYCPICQK